VSIETTQKVLSQKAREEVFRIATKGLVHFHGNKFADGMTDKELEDALVSSLGIFGGSGGPDCLSVSYKGAGLKIWGGWHVVNHVTEPPLFQGRETIAMAREIYSILDPDKSQMQLI
jgi:hypothetical protein